MLKYLIYNPKRVDKRIYKHLDSTYCIVDFFLTNKSILSNI